MFRVEDFTTFGTTWSAGLVALLTSCAPATVEPPAPDAVLVPPTPGRTAGEIVRDRRVEKWVKSALVSDPNLPGLDMEVEVYKSDATLKGLVNSGQQAERALALAEAVFGVRYAYSDLEIKGEE